MIYPECLEKIISYFQKFPGVGEKSAERLGLGVLNLKEDEILDLCKQLKDSKSKLKPCQICGNLTDKDECIICRDGSRNNKMICVLEDQKSLYAFEKSGHYQGSYHILNGLISPIDNVKPEDINIFSLIERCKKEKPEVIIALKSTIEGETTTLYIKKILEKYDIKVSRLSYGIPMGAEIEYLDALTLDRALSDRKIIS